MPDYTDDFVDIEPFEGEPDFKSSGVLNDNHEQDDKEEADA